MGTDLPWAGQAVSGHLDPGQKLWTPQPWALSQEQSTLRLPAAPPEDGSPLHGSPVPRKQRQAAPGPVTMETVTCSPAFLGPGTVSAFTYLTATLRVALKEFPSYR